MVWFFVEHPYDIIRKTESVELHVEFACGNFRSHNSSINKLQACNVATSAEEHGRQGVGLKHIVASTLGKKGDF